MGHRGVANTAAVHDHIVNEFFTRAMGEVDVALSTFVDRQPKGSMKRWYKSKDFRTLARPPCPAARAVFHSA